MKSLKLSFALSLLTFVFMTFPQNSSGAFDKCYYCTEKEGEDIGYKNCGGQGPPRSPVGNVTRKDCGVGGSCYTEKCYKGSRVVYSARTCVYTKSAQRDCIIKTTGISNGCITIRPSDRAEMEKCPDDTGNFTKYDNWESDWTIEVCLCNHTSLCNHGRQKPNNGGRRGGKLSLKQVSSGIIAVLYTWMVMIIPHC